MKHPALLPDLPPPPGQPDLYYLKLEPGAPLPADLSPDAQRYRLERGYGFRDGGKIVAGVAVTMAVGGIALWLTDAPGWLAGTVLFGALVAGVLAGCAFATADLPRYVPADGGEYVRAPRSVVAERLGTLAGPVQLSMSARIGYGVVSAFFVALMVRVLAREHDDGIQRIDILAVVGLLVALGAGLMIGWRALKGGGAPLMPRVEIPASPWFHALADPSAPLPDDAPISGPRSNPLADPSPPPDER